MNEKIFYIYIYFIYRKKVLKNKIKYKSFFKNF